jgi:uncharacterized protein DUF3574
MAHSPRLMLVCILAVTAACASHGADGVTPRVSCEPGDTTLVRDVVYFGRNKPAGGTVSETEWQTFLDEVVTPRFPAGLTVTKATGQWRAQSGVVEREEAEVLTVFHAGDPAARQALTDISAEYKRRFQQEAVLRERTVACARFQ